jgi:hypothetical protein
MMPLLSPSSAKIRSERSPRTTRSADSISQGVWRSRPDGGAPEFLPHQFQIFHFAGATLAPFEMQLAGRRIRRVQFSVKNAWRTSSQSEQAPAVLMLDSGAGGGSMAMRTISLSEDISWLA